MAVKLRLKRLGKKKQPFYRLVAADGQTSRDGKTLETIGTYDPQREPVHFEIKKERLAYWLGVGAQPTDPVRRLLGDAGVLPKIKKTPVNPGVSKKDLKAQAESE